MTAFPGAEGFGANSVGGRGGTVYQVTNLNDSGSGSLREALEASGARTVVFRTGGTITLEERITITNPYVTIAGQTAPGGGIALKTASTTTQGTLLIETHDVIMRYIRIRTGASDEESSSRGGLGILNEDIEDNVYNVIIDHCSISWATDENVLIYYDARDITIQWCIISECLQNSTHAEGSHSMGLLASGIDSGNISIHHNLFAHNNARNPNLKTSTVVDVVNNVNYNIGIESAYIEDTRGTGIGNFVCNYYRRGEDSNTHYYLNIGSILNDGYNVYLQGNITPNRTTDDMAENLCVHPNDRSKVSTTRNTAPAITTTSALEALYRVLEDAGANKTVDSYGVFTDNRDDVDTRIVNDVRNRTGNVIDDPSDVDGWPSLAAGTAPVDSDSDGMPDDWENAEGLDPDDAADNILVRRDGYENLEHYFNPSYSIPQNTSNLENSIRTQYGDKLKQLVIPKITKLK